MGSRRARTRTAPRPRRKPRPGSLDSLRDDLKAARTDIDRRKDDGDFATPGEYRKALRKSWDDYVDAVAAEEHRLGITLRHQEFVDELRREAMGAYALIRNQYVAGEIGAQQYDQRATDLYVALTSRIASWGCLSRGWRPNEFRPRFGVPGRLIADRMESGELNEAETCKLQTEVEVRCMVAVFAELGAGNGCVSCDHPV